MKYKIVCAADFHWGVMDADKQYNESQFILDYLNTHDCDLFVVCGDYFDHRLLMNSKSAFNSIKLMDEIKTISKIKNFKIVMFDGTESHDYDQLEIFRSFEDESFIIYRETTFAETLPGLSCMYAPDANMTTNDYIVKYGSKIMDSDIDIMFFHGTFDTIMVDRTLDDDIPNVIFEYSFFNHNTHLMVGGHWHDGDKFGNMFYIRSPYRWSYGEDLPKGIMSITYDTDKKEADIERIENPNTDRYFSFEVDTSLYTDVNNYAILLKQVQDQLDSGVEHIRIKVIVTDDKDLNKSCIDNLINTYQGHKRVKVVVINKYNKQMKKKKAQELDSFKDKFKYVFDGNTPLPKLYRQFILDTKGIDIPEERIMTILSDMDIWELRKD